MVDNIIQEVQDIEAEADRLVSEAGEEARTIAGSVAPQLERFRQDRERELEDRIAALKQELDEQTETELHAIKKRAQRGLETLNAITDATLDEAAGLVIERVSGGRTE